MLAALSEAISRLNHKYGDLFYAFVRQRVYSEGEGRFMGYERKRGAILEFTNWLIKPDAKVYVIDDAELERVKASYPVIWKDKDATPRLCFMGCPHMTFSQLNDWTEKLEAGRWP